METDFTKIIDHPIPRIEIIDVGAMMEGEERYHQLISTGLARVTGFEPDPVQHARLSARADTQRRYLPVFLGDGQPGTFHVARYPGCSSLLKPNARLIDLFETIGCADSGGNFHIVETCGVNTSRLDDLGEDVNADYLKLDVQGFELRVLENAREKLARTCVIECEVEFVPLYENQPLFGDIQCFLREQGFVFHKLIDIAGRPFRPFQTSNPFLPMSQALWADAIFVRDFTHLEHYTDEALLKTAAILDVVYRSCDLAGLLLAEHDRRLNRGLLARYAASLGSRNIDLQCMNLKTHP